MADENIADRARLRRSCPSRATARPLGVLSPPAGSVIMIGLPGACPRGEGLEAIVKRVEGRLRQMGS